MNISILTVGDELLEGVIGNSNAQWFGQELWALGLSVSEHVTVSDKVEEIAAGITRLTAVNDVCIISGGLGPTTDDVTVQSIAVALNDEIITDPEQYERLRKVGLSEGRAQHQARRPKSARAYDNSDGHAPLLEWHIDQCLCIALPGVPREFKAGFDTRLRHQLSSMGVYSSKSMAFINLGESTLMKTVQSLSISAEVECRYLASPPLTYLRLRSQQHAALEDSYTQVFNQLHSHHLPEVGDELIQALHSTLTELELTVATAESCTSGLIAGALADNAGSSQFLLGGIVAYSNDVKMNQLEVKPDTLREFGAVSEPCAREMAQNVARIMGSNIGLSVTGIAGPSGGSADKPVGTVCFGWHLPQETIVQTVLFRGDRASIRRASAVWSVHRCLELIRARG